MKTNKVSRNIALSNLVNPRTLKEIKENKIDVYDIDGKRLDTTTIEGLKKAHTTISKAYPYIYDALYNILNDKVYSGFIDKTTDKYFYKIQVDFNLFMELALGCKKNYYQKPYLLKELKTFKTENKIIKLKDRYLHAPPLMFVLDAGAKKIISNLDKKEYSVTSEITIYFSKPLFYEAVEKKNYSYFLIAKNQYSEAKRLIEHLSIIASFSNTNEKILFSDFFNVNLYTKCIYYLLTKNNKSNKTANKKDGTTKSTPSVMNINLFDFAKHVYPDCIIPNTYRLRNRETLKDIIIQSIVIHNIILTQNKITNITLTLSRDIVDNATTNKKNDIIIFVREYSEIENEIISMFNFIFSKMLSKQNEVLNSVISERIQNKTKFKKALENFSNNFIKNIEKSEKQYGIIKHGNLNQITISDPMDIHNNNIAVRKLLHFI